MRRSFSLIEVILSVALFALVSGLFIFLIIESYKINERAQDLTLATFLAEEGIEAVRSIRDADFNKLVSSPRSYCLAIENNQWVLKRILDRDCIEKIGKFSRQIYISSITTNKRKIVSLVTWQPRTGPRREVRLFSRITNWTR